MQRRAALFLLSSFFVGAGCLSRPIETNEPETTQAFTDSSIASIERIDVLLAIDNSGSMGDKQTILADAVPALVRGLLSPSCVDDSGKALPADQQPSTPFAPCPALSSREFTPVVDVHVGIVSSTLDSQCYAQGSDAPPDDGGRLVARSVSGSPVSTYKSEGFLDWDPKEQETPPGESVLPTFEDHVRTLVQGVNQNGCGYEAQLESWYRFLVEPAPHDQKVLDERKEFLRDDSLVAIILLSDENDCSVKIDSTSRKVLDSSTRQTRGRAICVTKPDDPCCTPCGEEPKGCEADPTCQNPTLSKAEDPINLRCFDQKRRFGRDSLFPVQRYIDGLTKAMVIDINGNEADNPLFPGSKAGPLGRTPEAQLVYFAGIVGVPWQDIARKTAAKPDLEHGLDSSGAAVGGLFNADEMNLKSGPWGSTWDLVLGDPDHQIKPQDALMHESQGPRKGENPILDAALASPAAMSPTANPINGHEWHADLEDGSDLQYACIFNLPKPFDVGNSNCATDTSCPCNPTLDNPLCQAADGTYSTTQQFSAKAYPGIRELQVLKGIGQQGIVGSICPAQLADNQAPDYGYQPAVGAIVDRLKSRLANDCIPIKLTPVKGEFPCFVLEAHLTEEGCDCNSPGRKPITKKSPSNLAKDQVEKEGTFSCVCEIDALEGDARKVCQNDPGAAPAIDEKSIDGWCYVDPINGEGSFAVVKSCPADEKRELRFVNGGKAEPKTATFITCVE